MQLTVMRIGLLRIGAFGFAAFLVGVAPATPQVVNMCVNPMAPLCLERPNSAPSEEACKDGLRLYVSELETYAQCMETNASSARQRAEDLRKEYGVGNRDQ